MVMIDMNIILILILIAWKLQQKKFKLNLLFKSNTSAEDVEGSKSNMVKSIRFLQV